MKKILKTLSVAALAVMLLAGCDVTDVNMDDVKDTASSAVSAASEVADAAKEMVPDSVKESIKEAKDEITSEAGEVIKEAKEEIASEAGQKVKEALKDTFKKAAKKVTEKTLEEEVKKSSSSTEAGLLTGVEDIGLTNTDGKGENYTFTYDSSEFSAIYTTDNWQIIDSYLITNGSDMLIICQALIAEHPIHGKDMVSYRTAEDMVYEWKIHNIAYAVMDEDDPKRIKSKDVDFDPKDQNMTIEDVYKDRIEGNGQN